MMFIRRINVSGKTVKSLLIGFLIVFPSRVFSQRYYVTTPTNVYQEYSENSAVIDVLEVGREVSVVESNEIFYGYWKIESWDMAHLAQAGWVKKENLSKSLPQSVKRKMYGGLGFEQYLRKHFTTGLLSPTLSDKEVLDYLRSGDPDLAFYMEVNYGTEADRRLRDLISNYETRIKEKNELERLEKERAERELQEQRARYQEEARKLEREELTVDVIKWTGILIALIAIFFLANKYRSQIRSFVQSDLLRHLARYIVSQPSTLIKVALLVVLSLGLNTDAPTGYFTFLKLSIFTLSGICGGIYLKSKNYFLSIIFLFLVLLFNPFIKIPFEDDVWINLEILAIVLISILLVYEIYVVIRRLRRERG